MPDTGPLREGSGRRVVLVGLVGDRDDSVPAHLAIPKALERVACAEGIEVIPAWLPTERIDTLEKLEPFDGIWCVPASPYRSMAGALRAIGWARTQGRPFLGTCGGFQHAVIEYARAVLGWEDAEHAESAPGVGRPVIVPLACSLVEAREWVHFRPGSRLHAAYGVDRAMEGYRCRYALSPDCRRELLSGALQEAAHGPGGEVRGVELEGHPFFVATLFQPERAAMEGQAPPLVRAFVRAMMA